MEIHVEKYGIIHYYAQCKNCGWDAAIFANASSTQGIRNLIRKHIKETGHSVHLESTSATRYSKQKQ